MKDSWSETQLEDLFYFVIGGDWGKDLSESDLEFQEAYCIRGAEMRNWDIDKGKTAVLRKVSRSSLEKRKLQEGDILVEISGGGPDQPVGRTVFIDKSTLAFEETIPKVCTNFLRLVRLVESIEKKYVNYYLSYFYKSGEVINYQGGSNNLRNLKFPEYSKIQIPIAPLQEQKRIVAKLDTLFTHIDQLKGRLENIPILLKRFRQTVLTQAVTGKLTEQWRENNTNINFDYLNHFESKVEFRDTNFKIPREWQFFSFEAVAVVKSFLVQPLEFLDSPLIAPDNIESETGRLISKPLVKDIMPKSPKHFFESGNIIYSKIRPYLSKIIIANFSGLCSADMYPIQAKIDTRYLFLYMLSKEFLEYATTAGTRTVLPKINQAELSIIPVPVPPLEEQKQIAQRVESLFAIAERIESNYNSLQEKIDYLPQAILFKAFTGELVTQDPNDEPATALLDRIKQNSLDDSPREGRNIVEKYFEEATIDTMEIYEVIEDAKRKLTAKEVWQKSRFKDDIDGFYAELKEEVEVKKRIRESDDGKYLISVK